MSRSANVRKTLPALKRYMEKHGYTGLYINNPHVTCGCTINDLVLCGVDHLGCKLGYTKYTGKDWHVYAKKPKEESK